MKKEILRGSIMVLAGAALVLSSRAYDSYQSRLDHMQTELIEEAGVSVVAHNAYLNWTSPVAESSTIADTTVAAPAATTETQNLMMPEETTEQLTSEALMTQEVSTEEASTETTVQTENTVAEVEPLVQGEDRTLFGFSTGSIPVDNEIRKMLDAKIPYGLSDLENKAVSYVNNLNIREAADSDSAVLGTLQEGEVVTVLETQDAWTKIASSKFEGYVSNEYLCTDLSAMLYIAENYDYVVSPKVSSVRVRAEKSTDSAILANVAAGTSLCMQDADDAWITVALADGQTGYVAAEYVDAGWNYENSVVTASQEEQTDEEQMAQDTEQKTDEVKETKADDQKSEKTEVSKKAETKSAEKKTEKTETKPAEKKTEKTETKPAEKKTETKSAEKKAEKTETKSAEKKAEKTETKAETDKKKDTEKKTSGQDVVDYALQFVGNPYKAGGTSLTKGADCSGFTQSVYKHFGYSLNRSSSGQRSNGKKVSLDDIKAGDIICYPGHVAIYIGGGKIVHASTPKGGIKVGDLNYTKPSGARRIVE